MKHPDMAASIPVAVTILVMMLPLAAAPASAGRITLTSAGQAEGTVAFQSMGWNNTTSVTIPAGADVLIASLSITGLPSEYDTESYPGAPGLSIGGRWVWKFEGDADGLLGRQSEFVMAPTDDKIRVGQSPAVLNIRLPALAVVSEASVVLEGSGVLSPNLDAGADGSPDWSYSGAFSTAETVTGLAGPMNDFLRNRAFAFPDAWGNQMTSVPVLLGAETDGTLMVTGLRVIYEAVLPVFGLGPVLNEAAHSVAPGDTTVPLSLFSEGLGRLRVSNISIDYNHPPTATLLAPAKGAIVNTTDVILGWSSADLDNDPLVFRLTLRGIATNLTDVPVTGNSYTASGLEPGDYSWWVIPGDGFQNGTCLSGVFSFRIVSPGTVPVIALLDPADGAALAAGPVALRWTPYRPVSGEVSYNIYLDESTATTLFFELFGSANNSFLAASLPADRDYRWTVVPYLSEGSATTKGYCASGIWGFTVGNPAAGGPHPPRIDSTPPANALVGYEYSYKVVATDENRDALTYSLVQSPSGMVIDFSGGLLRWTPEPGQTGTFCVTLSVTNGRLVARQAFSVTVTTGTPPPPSIRIAHPAEGSRANRSLYLMGTAVSAPGALHVRAVEVRLDSGPWQPANFAGDGWTFLLDTSRSMNGPHIVAVRAYDGTARSPEAFLNLTYDNPRSVLLDYPLEADGSPIPFVSLVAVILVAGPAVIYSLDKRRERRALP